MQKLNLVIILFVFSLQILLGQKNPSIHQLEYEKHFHLKENKLTKVDVNEEIIPLDKSVAKNLTHSVFGFYPDWEYQDSSHKYFNYDLLTHIAAFDFAVSATGQITDPFGWPWTGVINDAHANGVKMIMVIVNFEADDINKILTNSFTRWAFMIGVQTKLKKYNLDGVNIDFEGMNKADRGFLLNGFMQELTDSVHSISDDLEVSFDAPAVNWGGWDLTGLANSCDYLFVMGYDFYGSWSTATGPTAPLVSNTSYNVTNTINVEYATVSSFYPEKLILGVPYYGPHWKTSSGSEGAAVTGWVGSERFYIAQQASENYGLNWSTIYKNAWYNFVESEENHQVWFDNDSSLGLKYDLAIKKNLKGVGMWALGYDRARDELWNLIEEKFTSVVGVGDEEIVPTKFNLGQNYPNPFNPRTSIQYSVVEGNQNVLLRVYDVLGRNVKTLVNTNQGVGIYEVKFDASRLPSGVYYYTLQQGNYFETKKMLLIK